MLHARRRVGGASRVAAHVASCDCGGLVDGFRVPGGSSCPSFIPADLLSAVQKNHDAAIAVATALEALGGAIPGVGILVGAAGEVLIVLASGCDVGASFRQQCKVAALGCTVGAIAFTVMSAASALSIAGLPAAPLLIALAGVCTGLAPVLDKLGNGKTPNLQDVGGTAAALGGLSGFDLSPVKSIAGSVPPQVVTSIMNDPHVKAIVASAPSVAKSASIKSASDAHAKALADAKAKAAAATQELKDGWVAAGKPGTFQQYMSTHSAHDAALDSAKAKARAATAAMRGGVHHKGGELVHLPFSPSPAAVGPTHPSVAKKIPASTPIGAAIGAVGGFLVGGPIGAGVGAVVGGVAGHVVGKKRGA